MDSNISLDQITKAVELSKEYPTLQAAADAMGLSIHSFRRRLKRAQKMGIEGALSPAAIPHGLGLHKTTVLYDPDGNVKLEWRQLMPELEALIDFVEKLTEPIKGTAKQREYKPKTKHKQELMKEICLQDIHFGRLCDPYEVGSEYNLEVAAKATIDTVKESLHEESYGKITIVFGGDITHQDNQKNSTPKSGHVLDVDSRYYRTVAVASASLREAVEIATEHAPEVEVICLAGNHDLATGVCMRYILDAYFHNCPGVTVAMEPTPRVCRTWGKSMIVWAHGDCVRPNKWVEVVATEFPRQWAMTTDRHCHLGHRHSKHNYASQPVASMPGLLVSFLPSLCPADSWAVEHGYVGVNPGTETFVYHKEWGMIRNETIPFDMVK